MTASTIAIAIVSFVLSGVAYAALSLLLASSLWHSPIARLLVLVTAGTTVWSILMLSFLWTLREFSAWLLVIDAVHLALWVAFVASLLKQVVPRAIRWGRAFVGATITAVVVLALATGLQPVANEGLTQLQLLSALAVPLLGLLSLEQVQRNSTFEWRDSLRLLTISIGWIFAINIFVFSQALLLEAVSPIPWVLRGLGCAAVAPLILLALKRQPTLGERLFVSRQVVFYTTSLAAVGLYLLAMAAGGYLIGVSDLTWGPALQASFLVLAAGVLFYVLFSRVMRNKLRVFLAKHFFRNRYDYREEWLKLMQTLFSNDGDRQLSERSVMALADIIDSGGGQLWFIDTMRDSFLLQGSWPIESGQESDIPASLAEYLRRTRWIVDSKEYLRDPEKYSNAFDSIRDYMERPAIFVPLVHENVLVGIVRLDRPRGLGQLGFEDHDLLKMAGQQVAICLVQERDTEALSETRQFEAFSRLTAFMMHDLKNMISQHELIVGNAKRYKDRPEFVDDAMSTIEASVQRLRKLLNRLRAGVQTENTARVDIAKLLLSVASACADREPTPRVIEQGDLPAWVAIDRERLAMAVTHAVRNAQDATTPDGSVEIRLCADRDQVRIEVVDDGEGMDESFVRDSLFKPFVTTKGAKGMGIGAYQIRETARSVGGDVVVRSDHGRGTELTITLPRAKDKPEFLSEPAA